jgi:ABC-type multidrug transport system ATPase subunit
MIAIKSAFSTTTTPTEA